MANLTGMPTHKSQPYTQSFERASQGLRFRMNWQSRVNNSEHGRISKARKEGSEEERMQEVCFLRKWTSLEKNYCSYKTQRTRCHEKGNVKEEHCSCSVSIKSSGEAETLSWRHLRDKKKIKTECQRVTVTGVPERAKENRRKLSDKAAKKHTERYSTSLIIRVNEVKTTKRD